VSKIAAARKAKIDAAVAVVVLLVGTATALGQSLLVQLQLDGRLVGMWIRAESGDTIEFRSNGDTVVSLSGQFSMFSGVGAISRCTDAGANFCISLPRSQCAYRYEFLGEVMNLRLAKGDPFSVCKALAGDYSRKSGR
jgi:hypothetical protein